MMPGKVAWPFVVLAISATAAALKTQPVSDAAETIGNAYGSAGESVGGAGRSAGVDKVGEAGGGAVTGAGNAVGNAGGSVGATPDNVQHVPVVGGNFRPDAMSTSLSCVINLTIQYVLVYTALAVVQTFADFLDFNINDMRIGAILEQACLTVNYAPMLACLFLAVRMRVNWLTQGKGNPPTTIQVCMLCCTYAVLAMTLVSLVVPIFTGNLVPMKQHGDHHHIDEDHNPFENKCLAVAFTILKYLIMIGLYVGVVIIIFGICTYTPPPGSWPGDEIPPPSPAVACTMILTATYFIIYALIQAGKTFLSFFPNAGEGMAMSKINGALEGAVCTMAFAPMLSILFIAARMRALQMDPIHGHPQRWAQHCFYACTYAVMVAVILAIAVPLVMGGKVKQHEEKDRNGNPTGRKNHGDVQYEVDHPVCGAILELARWLVIISIYLGVVCIIWSIFTIQHPMGPEYTPPISVTMQCVINLTVQYFLVYLLIWICITINERMGWDWHILSNAMWEARATVAFCPMLAILFVGVRMRALRLTNNRGAPQGWVQDGMYMATWAILIQFFMVLLIPVATFIMSGGDTSKVKHAEIDKHGEHGVASGVRFPATEEHRGSMIGKILLVVFEIVRWLGFVLLYGGAITVIVGAIMMTPETANGRGSLPLVRETPVGNEPKGANDIPGMPAQGSAPAADSNASAGL